MRRPGLTINLEFTVSLVPHQSQQTHKGRCLCGAVTYAVQGVPIIVAHCHCEDCQRLSGAGHSTGAMYAEDNFRLDGQIGKYNLKSERGNIVTRVFCPACGSSIHGQNTGMPGFVTVSLGTLDDSSDFKPAVVVFARNRKRWDLMDEELLTFAAQPHWKPE